MRPYSLFRSGLLLVLLCLFIAEGKKASSGKNSCRKGMISKVTDNLYVKATTFKASIPKDLIKNRRLLKKTTKKLFMKNCSVRDQLLSFYMKNVFGGLGFEGDKVYVVSAFQALQENLNNCGCRGCLKWFPSYPGFAVWLSGSQHPHYTNCSSTPGND
uniref:Uncharacterized protein n=1 Tax=Chelydra serpentina TaxID=8475 RepID=A0A8C3RK50_CHESE